MKQNGVIAPLLGLYTGIVLIFVLLPLICVGIMSFSPTRFLSFPFRRAPTLKWFEEVFTSLTIQDVVTVSFTIAVAVTIIAVVFATLGALAFARYDFRGRGLYQKMLLLPIFFPQGVLGLGLLLWFNVLGIPLDWKTAALGHLVWLTPIVTVVIAIQAFEFDASLEAAARDLGAGRLRTFFSVTLPLLGPGIFSGGLFAFLLSWVNFPISLYTAGIDTPAPMWMFSKMAVTFTPSAPALGFVIFVLSIVVVVPAFLILYRRR